ncbi:DDE superfamily endonuclease [Pochonia chlamydosporia 170]|uniref:DDE superfamily endonuclease n=1 Tax=Pochonia chlamydosporia 170 TaxID=1380566 RepID=A0A179EYJ6_METCM|nr:DDE superfamily endonuclease [Pochonia chlamydosporia 170]OAQ58232.1 DDE superfamily endonuclease [Pochonia chlamydosporia 170]
MAANSVQATKGEVEIRVDEAIQYIDENPGAKIAAVARIFNVSRSRLRRRIEGIPPQKGRPSPKLKLSRPEEAALCNYINRLDDINFAVRPEFITDAANYILKERAPASSTAPAEAVGKLWTTRFIQRHQYQKVLQKKLDSNRQASEDVTRVLQYYTKLKEAIAEYGIPDEDIWNMDETGFRIGIGKDQFVVTKRKRAHLFSMPENREAATGIEAISAGGEFIPAFMILSGQQHMDLWYRLKELEDNTKIALSSSGYTNDQLSLAWLHHFNEHAKATSRYRLLILDGHGSHHTIEFIEFCNQHRIIPFAMSPNLTHILQPLDVVVFQPLKHYHAKALDVMVRDGLTNVTKIEFLSCIQSVRKQAFKRSTIISAFRKTGISPFNPQPILEMLSQRAPIQTPSPVPAL